MASQIFDTTQFPQRKNTHSVKWDTMASRYGREDLLPLWVADMDFASPPCIVEALRKAADFGVFGYFAPPASYQDAFIHWETERHGVTPERAWLRFTPGVITGMFWAISSLTAPGDSVAILTPCYYPFMDAVADTGRRLVCSSLVHTQAGYEIDWADLENAFKTQNVKMLLLCSPHNPVGRVWREEELSRLLNLCAQYGVLTISDEIHQDIVFGCKNVSCLHFTQHFSRLIVLTSGSKTFNIAGLQNSFAIIPDESLRQTFDAYVKTLRIKKGVSFGYIAAEAGFRDGAPWLDEMLTYLQGNYDLLKSALTTALPGIHVEPLEGTYMVWVDLSAYVAPDQVVEVVQNQAHLAVDFGFWFWPKDQVPENDAHIRINIATSRDNVKAAAESLIAAIENTH